MRATTYNVRVDGCCMLTTPSYKKAFKSFNKAKVNNANAKVAFVKEETLAVHQPSVAITA
ncbi:MULTISPECIES: hypothetical protein [unclassified Pseudoalteromonas]|uniref:hypothetical protein n=1 Tax=unclassified Pseudoalteromonas TaxID=194690 RepID=UPI00301C8D18